MKRTSVGHFPLRLSLSQLKSTLRVFPSRVFPSTVSAFQHLKMPLNAQAIYPASEPDFVQFPSRRSVVHSTNGIVACSQPLAAEAGQRILKQGGNAAVRNRIVSKLPDY